MLTQSPASILFMGSSNYRLVGENISYLIAIKLATRATLADAMGVSVQAVGQLIRGETKELRPSNLVRAAKHLGLTADDLISRNLRAENWHPTTHIGIAEPGAKYSSEPLIFFPMLSLAGAGGPGLEDGDLEIIDELAFKREWIKKEGWEPKQLFVAKVRGDSMAHWMPGGNIALVHRGDSVIRESGDPYANVFALMDGPAFRFKKIELEPDGALTLRSFNDDKGKYPDERRSGQEVDSILRGIIGRVVWRGG